MSNNREKAEALRQLANILETGELPEHLYNDQPIRIGVHYDNHTGAKDAMHVFKQHGHRMTTHPGVGYIVRIGAEHDYYCGVEFSLWFSNDENEDI